MSKNNLARMENRVRASSIAAKNRRQHFSTRDKEARQKAFDKLWAVKRAQLKEQRQAGETE